MATSRWDRIGRSVMTFLVGTFGLPMMGAEVLEVRGRTSGVLHRVPVGPFHYRGETYLLSARRDESQWMKNLRAAGEGTLRRGRRARAIRVRELSVDEKMPILFAYLERWGPRAARSMGIGTDAGLEEMRAILEGRAVFRVLWDGQAGGL